MIYSQSAGLADFFGHIRTAPELRPESREALTQAMVLRSPSATAGFSSFLAKQA